MCLQTFLRHARNSARHLREAEQADQIAHLTIAQARCWELTHPTKGGANLGSFPVLPDPIEQPNLGDQPNLEVQPDLGEQHDLGVQPDVREQQEQEPGPNLVEDLQQELQQEIPLLMPEQELSLHPEETDMRQEPSIPQSWE